jgi:hypothetical protein
MATRRSLLAATGLFVTGTSMDRARAATPSAAAPGATCTGPCYGTTAAERAAGVTPTNFSVRPQIAMPQRYGAAGNGSIDDLQALRLTAAVNQGQTVDGGGLTYLVNGGPPPNAQVPPGPQYHNIQFLSPQTVNPVDNWNNVAIGIGALVNNQFIPEQFSSDYPYPQTNWAAGNHNVAIGGFALSNNTTGRRNTAIGSRTMMRSTSAYYNTTVGSHSMQVLTTGLQNSAFGVQAAGSLTSGSNNTLLGCTAGNGVTVGSGNTVVGYTSLVAESGGSYNTVVGTNAALSQQGVSETCAFGYLALESNLTGSQCNAFGAQALSSNRTGDRNNAFGWNALRLAVGSSNTAMGDEVGFSLTTGAGFTAVGCQAGWSMRTNHNGTFLGYQAGLRATGAENTLIGSASGASLGSGANCTGVGYGCDFAAGADNQTSLGNGAVCTDANQVTLGNPSVNTLRCAAAAITSVSDARDKTDIGDLPVGLELINALKPRRFTWNKRDGSRVGVVDSGFIAQELDSAQLGVAATWLGLVDHTNPERLETTPAKLIPPLVRAVQQLATRVEALEAELAKVRAPGDFASNTVHWGNQTGAVGPL